MFERSFPALSQIPELRQEVPPTEQVVRHEPADEPAALVTDPRTDLMQLATGLGFAALYGVALGARAGGLSLVRNAFSASAGLLSVGVLGVPSLFVLLALVNAPVAPSAMLSAGARALASAGLVLAGLAPSALLLVVTIESPSAAAFVARAGLALAGGIGLYQLVRSVRSVLCELPGGVRFKSNALLAAFCVFAALLAARVWGGLPILSGGA